MVTIENGFAIFTTDHFSAYTLAEEHEHEYADGKCACGEEEVVVPDEEIQEKPSDKDEIDKDVPQTGDNANARLVFVMACVSMLLIVGNRIRKRV